MVECAHDMDVLFSSLLCLHCVVASKEILGNYFISGIVLKLACSVETLL